MRFKDYKYKAMLNPKAEMFNFEIDGRNHYVYRITNLKTKKHYYGSRVSVINPKDDLGIYYFSSSSDKHFINSQKVNPQDFKYKIVKIFNNKDDMNMYESFLHQYFNVRDHELFYNRYNQNMYAFCPSGLVSVKDKYGNNFAVTSEIYKNGKHKHVTSGTVTVKTDEGKHFRVKLTDPRYLSGALKANTKGTILVYDSYLEKYKRIPVNGLEMSNDNIKVFSKNMILAKNREGLVIRLPQNDPLLLTKEFVPIATNKVPVKDVDGNIMHIDRDEYYKSNKYKHVTSGTTTSFDLDSFIIKRIQNEEYAINNNLIGSTSSILKIYDKYNALMFICILSEFQSICKIYKMSNMHFSIAYKKNIPIPKGDYKGWRCEQHKCISAFKSEESKAEFKQYIFRTPAN